MSDNSAIYDKVAKLLAKGRDPSCTEAEADAFMAGAQRLMVEHNLSIATLEATSPSGPAKEKRVKEAAQKSLMYKWKRDLLTQIAVVNFCYLSIRMERTASGQEIAKGYDLIGRLPNVVSTHQTFEYLLEAVERVLVQEVGTNPQDRYNRWSHTFRQGCGERLGQRLTKRHKDYLEQQAREAREANARAKHPGSTSTAVAVVMADFAQTEADLNNDIRNVWPAGKTAQDRLNRERYLHNQDVKRKAKRAEIVVLYPNPPDRVYDLMSYGYSLEEARKEYAKENKPETDAQARKRNAKDERWRERWHAQSERQNSYRYSEGYRAGYTKADSIGLDDQVDENQTTKIGE